MIAWIVPFFAEKRQGRGCFSSAPLALFQRICHPVQGGGVVLIQQVGVDLARGGGGGVAQGLPDVEQGGPLTGGDGGKGVPQAVEGEAGQAVFPHKPGEGQGEGVWGVGRPL